MTTGLIESDRVTTTWTWEVQPADPRAKAIVDQLMRKRRKTGRYYYPAIPIGDGDSLFAEERQQFAIWVLFSAAVSLSEYPTRPALLRRDLDAARASLLATAGKLRETIEMCEQLGVPALYLPHIDPPVDPLVLGAEGAEEMAANLDHAFFVVERDRGEMDARAFAVTMAGIANLIFGQPLCGIVAALTAIMLDRKVKPYRVRDWWADSSRKNKRPIPGRYS
jgi:hypothetical protein